MALVMMMTQGDLGDNDDDDIRSYMHEAFVDQPDRM